MTEVASEDRTHLSHAIGTTEAVSPALFEPQGRLVEQNLAACIMRCAEYIVL